MAMLQLVSREGLSFHGLLNIYHVSHSSSQINVPVTSQAQQGSNLHWPVDLFSQLPTLNDPAHT